MINKDIICQWSIITYWSLIAILSQSFLKMISEWTSPQIKWKIAIQLVTTNSFLIFFLTLIYHYVDRWLRHFERKKYLQQSKGIEGYLFVMQYHFYLWIVQSVVTVQVSRRIQFQYKGEVFSKEKDPFFKGVVML